MGLSIHYSGFVRDKKLIEPLTEEVHFICESLGWLTQTFDDAEIKGISFAPAGSEPVTLTFDKKRRLLSPINILVKEIYDGVQLNKELIFTASTKTQFAGPDAHITIIKLLKHISEKYLEDFTLIDEGLYWETGDEKTLLKQFKIYNAAIDSVGKALEGFTAIPGETTESLAERIEKRLQEKLPGNEK